MKKSLVEVGVRKIGGGLTIKNNAKTPTARDVAIYKMRRSGFDKDVIAVKFGCDIRSVSRAIGKVRRFYDANVVVDVSSLKIDQHMFLENLKEQVMKDYQDSSGEIREEVTETTKDGDVKKTVRIRQSKRDPRLALAAVKIIKEQREIWPGANAPKAMAQTNKDGTEDAITRIEVAAAVALLSPEQQQLILDSAFKHQELIEAEATKTEP